MAKRRLSLNVTRFEDRVNPAVQFFPPTVFLSDASLFATRPSGDAPETIARGFLAENAERLGASQPDFATALVKSNYTDADTGISHVYFSQTAHGLEVAYATMNVTIAPDGSVIAAGGNFIPDLETKLAAESVRPQTTALQAMQWAEAILEETNNEPMPGCNCTLCHRTVVADAPKGTIQTQVYQATRNLAHDSLIASAFSLDPVPAKLMFVPTEDGAAELSWNMVIRTTDNQNWFDLQIADRTGIVAAVSNWGDHAAYNAIPLPNESPVDGGFAVLAEPHLPSASPFGWHDTNGVAGPEFTDTRGNNANAYLDRDNNNAADASPPRPAGGSSLDFSTYSFDASQGPLVLQNQNSAVTNLFHLTNVIHDITYQYGFTPAAGNFQTNNYGQGGSGNDAVLAEAQDGSGTGNANFFTPADGSAPRMQMFIWTQADPDRTSDHDNGIVIHEYGHGVSNRLTGGPADANALNNLQSGGMGEGWSDFLGLMLTQRPTDTQNDAFGIGTYALNQPITGAGIRAYRYSYDMTNNPMMWDSYGTSGTTPYGLARSTAVHRTGTIWCTTLWDMNWLLINKYGYDSDLSTGWSATPGPASAGNKLALRLVLDAMKIQPANPSFVQARDAILAADTALTGGANHLQIWQAFARRGLGAGAVDNGSASSATLVNDTTIPASVLKLQVTSHTPADLAIVTTQPTNFTINLTEAIDAATIAAADFKVNGISATSFSYTPGSTAITFTFASTPVTANGQQTMTIAAGAFNRAADADPVQAFNASFRYDPLRLAVTSTSPINGASQAPPLTTFDVNLNEAVLPASVSVNDLRFSQGYATGFSLLNGNTTIRYTLTGLTVESDLDLNIPAGAFTDANGNPSLEFNASYQIDYTTFAFPALSAIAPAGARINEGTLAGLMNTTTDVDNFTIDLAAGQLLTASIAPASGLRPKLTILTPSSTTLATLTGSVTGQGIAISGTATVAGTYTIRVESAASTSGRYTLDATVNALQEIEAIVPGSTNHTFATAQPLTLQTETTSLGTARRAAVLGTTDSSTTYTANPVAYSFEDINATGTTILANADDANTSIAIPFTFNFFNVGYTSLNVSDNGLITFGGGTNSNTNGSLTSSPTQAAIAALWDDLENGADGVKWQVLGSAGSRRLIIQWQNNRYWTSGNTGTFTLQFQAVLFEGTNQIRLNYANLDANVTNSNGGRLASIGIKDSNTNGAARLLLSQNSTSIYHGNGVSTLISPPAPTKDYYSFTAAAGDRVSLALSSLTAGTPTLELFGSDGTTLLATATAGATNFTTGVASFALPAAGTYYAAVGGASGVSYSLSTFLGAFDREANNTAATAQALENQAFGALAASDTDWYTIVVPADSTRAVIESATPGTLNPKLDLFAANGTTLIATGTTLADGRNEIIDSPGLTPGGSYRLRITAQSSTTGDYLVQFTAPPAPAVDAVSINSDDPQRSRIREISVTFNRQVTVAPGAITLTRGATVLSTAPGGGLLANASLAGSQTVIDLSFAAVAGVEFGSLADGNWTLNITAAGVTAQDDSQIMIADFHQAGIKRLFGDINGDAVVQADDFAAFGNFFGITLPNANNPFDFNADGVILADDLAEFGNRFGITL